MLRSLPLFASLFALACGDSEPTTCVPGATVACVCTSGGTGAQACGADRTFGACECTGPTADTATADAVTDVDTSADTDTTTLTPMTVVAVSPRYGATGAGIDEPLVLTLSHDVDPTTVGALRVTANPPIPGSPDATVPGTVEVSGATLTFTPTAGSWQEYDTLYTVRLDSGLRGVDGRPMGPWAGLEFRTVFLSLGHFYRLHVVRDGGASALDNYGGGGREAYLTAEQTGGSYWYFQPEDGWLLLRSEYGGASFFLDSGDGRAPARLMPAASHGRQRWRFVAHAAPEAGTAQPGASAAAYYLESRSEGSGRALGVAPSAGPYDEASMQDKTGASTQLWRLARGHAIETPPPPADPYLRVAVSERDAICGLRRSGRLDCWGEGALATPPATTDVVDISMNVLRACLVKADKTIACWGVDAGTLPPATADFVAVDVGVFHACGLKENGNLVCWGQNPPLLSLAGPLRLLCSGNNHGCGVSATSGTINCWGGDFGGGWPSGNAFAEIGCASNFTCVRRGDKTLACWGNDAVGGTPAAPLHSNWPSGRFQSVGVGTYHACAIYAPEDPNAGKAACWGWNDSYGRATPPDDDDFVQVAVDGSVSCAVDTYGDIKCWGATTQEHPAPPLE